MAKTKGKTVAGKVSVIMPTYNSENFVLEAVKSVQNQTYDNWELIIVDDCSCDGTLKLIKSLSEEDKRITYFSNEKNLGAAAARSRAIDAATGQYIAFLDSDDRWDAQKIEKQLTFMKKMGASFSCTAYSRMDLDGNDLLLHFVPPDKTNYKKCIRLSNPIGNSTVMYDQSALGKFQVPNIKKRNDFALWLQILKRTDYCYGMEEVLSYYRSGRCDSISGKKLDLAKYHWQLYRKIEEHGILRSMYEVGCWAFVKGTGIGVNKVRARRQA